jgi:hypothetical protein
MLGYKLTYKPANTSLLYLRIISTGIDYKHSIQTFQIK